MTRQNTPTTIIIGYGNPLRRDDGAGPELVRRICARLGTKEEPNQHTVLNVGDTGFLISHQLIPELCEAITNYCQVVYIDASVAVENFCVEDVKLPCEAETIYHSHGLTPRQLTMLALLSQDNCNLDHIYILHLPAEDMGMGEGLTNGMEQHLNAGLDWLDKLIGGEPDRTVH